MLRYCVGWGGVEWGGVITFICTSSHTWCYATVCPLACPHLQYAMLLYVFLHVLTYRMLRYCMSACISSHTWCYATVCLLALPHIHDAVLLYVLLHVLTYRMLRYCMSSSTSSHTWCYATVCRLAIPHIHDATLLYVVLHVLAYMMLRYCMSSCTSSHTRCYATVCPPARPHIQDAMLLYVLLHFLKNDWWPQHVDATSKVAGHTLMSDDVKAMVNQWVFRQSLGPITPIAFLQELKRLLKQWGKKTMKCCFAVVWNNAKWGTSKKTLSFLLKIPFCATAVYQACTYVVASSADVACARLLQARVLESTKDVTVNPMRK